MVSLNLEWYPKVPSEVLEPTCRRKALLEHISTTNADVVCLQEVEPEVFEYMNNSLKVQGYTGRFTQKGRQRPDGCAMFIRTPPFRLQTFEELYYSDGFGKKRNSGHMAQVAGVKSERGKVGIINTHLRWDQPGEAEENRWGIAQMYEVLEYISKTAQDDWIICGDFNVLPHNSLITLLQNRGFRDAFSGLEQPTCYAKGRAEKLDYVFHSPGISSQPMEVADIKGVKYLPSFEHPSDHIILGAFFSFRRQG